jgi:hypothetical protein
MGETVLRLIQRYSLDTVRVALDRGGWRASLLPGYRWGNCVLAQVKNHYARTFKAHVGRRRVAHPDCFFGASHAGYIDLPLMRRFFDRCPSDFQMAEFALHPGQLPAWEASASNAHDWFDPLRERRPKELQMLVSPGFAELLASRGVTLTRLSAIGKVNRRPA